jgi:hypothetical protein
LIFVENFSSQLPADDNVWGTSYGSSNREREKSVERPEFASTDSSLIARRVNDQRTTVTSLVAGVLGAVQDSRSDHLSEGRDNSPAFTGFMTVDAYQLLARSGVFDGGGIADIERVLGFAGNAASVNYTAVGDTLFVEAIDANGRARRFAWKLGVKQGGRIARKAMNAPGLNLDEAVRDSYLVESYETIEIFKIYKKCTKLAGLKNWPIKANGRLPVLLRKAATNNLTLESSSLESPILIKRDGTTVGIVNESLNDRDRWEEALAGQFEKILSEAS